LLYLVEAPHGGQRERIASLGEDERELALSEDLSESARRHVVRIALHDQTIERVVLVDAQGKEDRGPKQQSVDADDPPPLGDDEAKGPGEDLLIATVHVKRDTGAPDDRGGKTSAQGEL